MTALGKLGFRPQIGQDPNKQAKEFAEKNGLGLNEAKSQLKAKFGDPEAPKQDAKIGSNNDTTSLFKTNTTQPLKDADPDDYAKLYAKMNNITVEEARKELSQKFGDPEKDTMSGGKIDMIA